MSRAVPSPQKQGARKGARQDDTNAAETEHKPISRIKAANLREQPLEMCHKQQTGNRGIEPQSLTSPNRAYQGCRQPVARSPHKENGWHHQGDPKLPGKTGLPIRAIRSPQHNQKQASKKSLAQDLKRPNREPFQHGNQQFAVLCGPGSVLVLQFRPLPASRRPATRTKWLSVLLTGATRLFLAVDITPACRSYVLDERVPNRLPVALLGEIDVTAEFVANFIQDLPICIVRGHLV